MNWTGQISLKYRRNNKSVFKLRKSRKIGGVPSGYSWRMASYILKNCELGVALPQRRGQTTKDYPSEVLPNVVAIRGHTVDIPGGKRIEKMAKNRAFSCPWPRHAILSVEHPIFCVHVVPQDMEKHCTKFGCDRIWSRDVVSWSSRAILLTLATARRGAACTTKRVCVVCYCNQIWSHFTSKLGA